MIEKSKTKKIIILGVVAISVSIFGIIFEIFFDDISKNKLFYGMAYSPLRQDQSPESQIHPSISDIENDIKYLSSLTNRLRIYDISGNNQFIPLIAEKYGIKLVIGISLTSNDIENINSIDNLARIVNLHEKTIDTIIVGNDVLAKKIVDEPKFVEYIHLVREKTNPDVNITVSESWEIWNQHPSLINEVDYVTIHIYPYYESRNVENSASYVIEVYEKFQESLKESQKQVIIGETGWPSEGGILGEAMATPENQRKFIEDFTSFAKARGIRYYIFEAFDENWKTSVLDSDAEQNFGLFYENGTRKEALIELIPELPNYTTRNAHNNSPDLDDVIWLSNYLESYSDQKSWILDLVDLWKKKSIDNLEFLNAVHYLIKSNIVRI